MSDVDIPDEGTTAEPPFVPDEPPPGRVEIPTGDPLAAAYERGLNADPPPFKPTSNMSKHESACMEAWAQGVWVRQALEMRQMRHRADVDMALLEAAANKPKAKKKKSSWDG